MKVLMVSPVLPFPLDGGLKMRVFGILRALAQKHDVDLLCFYREEGDLERAEPVRRLCLNLIGVPLHSCLRYHEAPASRLKTVLRAVSSQEPRLIRQWRSPAMEKELIRLALEKHDLVWISRLWMTEMAEGYPAKKVLDLDDLESIKLRRMLATLPWKLARVLGYVEALKLVKSERKALEKHDAVVVASEKDRRTLGAENVFVLPNTVLLSSDPVTASASKERSGDLIFFGQMDYAPNVDAVDYLCGRIWPLIKAARPDARLWLVGPKPAFSVQRHNDGKSVFVTGYVDDLLSLIASCAVAVAPLRIGGGTRIKILQAMAMAKPVVTTTIGCEGLEVAHGEHLLIADRPDEFARSCVALMSDAGKRTRLGERAQRLVEEKYRWELLPEIVDRIVERVCLTGEAFLAT